MGGLCSGKAKPKEVKVHELEFMGVCTEGAYNNPRLIDVVFNKAAQAG